MSDSKKLVSFLELRKIEPMMNWDDIKVGESYHIPPLVYNKRMDFVVIEKQDNAMKIKKHGGDYPQTLFKNDITTRFVVKKQDLHGNT